MFEMNKKKIVKNLISQKKNIEIFDVVVSIFLFFFCLVVGKEFRDLLRNNLFYTYKFMFLCILKESNYKLSRTHQCLSAVLQDCKTLVLSADTYCTHSGLNFKYIFLSWITFKFAENLSSCMSQRRNKEKINNIKKSRNISELQRSRQFKN